jgi:sulfatase maturation enzyme AslB (radical SAM superfamily)
MKSDQSFKFMEINAGANRLVAYLTRRCQLNCQHCFLLKKNIDMKEETLFRLIDLLFTSPRKHVELQFFGGEPLLRMDLIKKAVIYAKKFATKKKKNIRFSINTNAVILEKSKLNYFKKNAFVIYFTFNGFDINGKLLKDKNKKYTEVVEMLNGEYLIDKYLTYLIVTPKNLNNLSDNLLYLYGMKVWKLQIVYAIGSYWDKKSIVKLKNELDKFFNFNQTDVSDFLINFKITSEHLRIISPELGVDCNGDLYYNGAILLKDKFSVVKNNFYFGNVHSIKSLEEVSLDDKLVNEKLISLGKKDGNFAKIIKNNLSLYKIMNDYFIENKDKNKRVSHSR